MNILILAAEATHHANGSVLPGDMNEVIWGTISFLIVFTLILWKGGPAIKAMWNGRIDRIRTELETAAAARAGAEAKLAAVEASLADADNERERIVAEAHETAATVRAQIIAKAGTDATDLRARGTSDVEAAKAQATGDLQAEIGVLAIGAAEAVVANALDASTQSRLIDNYIDKVGA